MIKLYNKEQKYKVITNYLFELLRNCHIQLKIVDKIVASDDNLYIIVGGEYLLEKPNNYIVYQSLSTSSLTLSRGIEAYWITEEYINLLRNAHFIIDSSHENIKVWETHYKFSNCIYLDITYQSSLLSDNYRETYTINKNSPLYLLSNKRSKKIYDSYHMKLPNLKEITNRNYYKIIKEIKQNKGIFIWISEYDQTFPDIVILLLLRYNNIPCLVEKGRDINISNKCENLGVILENYIRIEKYFENCIEKTIKMQKTITTRKNNNNLDKRLLVFLDKYNINEKSIKKAKLKLYDRLTIPSVDFEILPDGGITLKLGEIKDDDLPKISLCTPTANRRYLFSIAISNFLNFIYPKNKLEWIILDDGVQSIKDIIPNDNRIKYIYDNKVKLPIGDKRNRLVELSSHDIIVFMDDDDYYAPESLLARVKSLLKYSHRNIHCVGSVDVATYDIIKNECAITSNGNDYLCESSLAFTRQFWKERKFRQGEKTGEFRYFLEYRQDKLLTIPFQFVTIALTHKNNTTGKVRSLLTNKTQNDNDNQKIFDILGEDFMELLRNIKKFI